MRNLRTMILALQNLRKFYKFATQELLTLQKWKK